jgi:peptide/nickel transport system ATP-binding protein
LAENILDVDKLKTNFYTYEGVVKALEEITFSLETGDTLGIVGETGCGKSVTVLSILQLIMPPGRIESGKIHYSLKNRRLNLLDQSELFMRDIRGNEISMIFQEASNALNPVLTINQQVSESYLLHRQKELCALVLEGLQLRERLAREKKGINLLFHFLFIQLLQHWYRNKMKKAEHNKLQRGRYGLLMKREAKKCVIQLLASLGIPNPPEIVQRYPHELSGGMQQRVVISMALACNPQILIADEPTSNLDVTIQAQILDLIETLKQDYHSSILFITHDLGVVSEIANKLIVLYAGTLVEFASVRELFRNPLHPYTVALLNSVPKIGKKERLESIRGNVPNLVNPPAGCRFHPRCPKVMEVCRKEKPAIFNRQTKGAQPHFVACFLYRM